METTVQIDTEKLLATFLEMVRIDSPSGGEEKMCAYLKERLKAMGLEPRVDAAGNLFADVPAHQCNHDSVLVLSGHMDVVPPCLGIEPVIEGEGDEREIYSDNTTVLGADDKSGLAPILEVVELALKENLPRPKLRLIFTVMEEVGLQGAKAVSEAELKAGFIVTLDHTGRQGTIIHQAPSYFKYKIEGKGKSVHAGIMPEKGINAIVFLGKVIERMKNEGHLGRIDEWTTANIGTIKGGKGTNVVPDSVVMEGELRSHKPETITKELKALETILEEEKQKMSGTDFEFEHYEEFRAYRIDPDHPGIQLVKAACHDTGLEPELIYTNGGSDNNVFIQKGLDGVVLSAGYVEPHSLKERVRLKEIHLCGQFLISILKQFANTSF